MAFFTSALALLAIFRMLWNLGAPLVTFAGGIVGLIAERKYPPRRALNSRFPSQPATLHP